MSKESFSKQGMRGKALALHLIELRKEINTNLDTAITYALWEKRDGINWTPEALKVFNTLKHSIERSEYEIFPKVKNRVV